MAGIGVEDDEMEPMMAGMGSRTAGMGSRTAGIEPTIAGLGSNMVGMEPMMPGIEQGCQDRSYRKPDEPDKAGLAPQI